ncbi:MAG: GSCFA domain protein [Bacteroidetes bacterium]|jgi:hypothetical protein|nr:GSCFA domain protein [Bacteroidota bacterium]
MLPLQTRVNLPEYSEKIGYNDPVMLVGSCFSENIGRQLANAKYQVMINPFGVMYNPISVKQNLDIIMNKKIFTKADLSYDNHLWFSYAHHTSFSKPGEKEILRLINTRTEEAFAHLKKTRFLFITFGTARIYRLKKTGQIVANCHKQPQQLFDHILPGIEEILHEYDQLIEQLSLHYPNLNLIFTVSPVRHWKDGAVGNQISKSTLILAIHKLLEKHKQCYYFPSYELFMDEMRDYRFYGDDLLHPSSLGIAYVWEKFSTAFLDKRESQVREHIDKIVRACQHKPHFPDSEEYQKFAQSTLQKMNDVLEKYPFLDLKREKEYFQSVLR